MKKLIGFMAALILVLSLCACGGQPAVEQKAESGVAAGTETAEVTEAAAESTGTNSDGVTQADIEKNIIGKWIKSEVDGQPALTNNKNVYTFESATKVYLSASINERSEEGADWTDQLPAEVVINNNKMSITAHPEKQTTMVHDFIITDINDNEFSADHASTYTVDGKEVYSREDAVHFIKVVDDFSEDILGTWEGHCTSEGSVFDDGQDHRWEYKDDGTYVYYVKDGDSWVPSDNEQNEYFVDGNLLCTRWVEGGTEYREWWEISIDGDKMNWTALREDEDGKTFTATFEMKRVEDASGEVTQADIEKNIVGTWIKSQVDGQAALTNEKSVYDIVSINEAYTSASHQTDEGTPFDYNQKSKVDINDNVVTITTNNSEGESYVHEFTVTGISDSELTANRKFTRTLEGADPLIKEDTVTFIKVNDDYSDDIIGTWEGRCTSEGSVFDDGQDHRWEFKDDGTYVYYVKNGDSWVSSEDTMNEYFVAGNLLCARWMENGQENREWWELSIDGDKMNWTALREGKDGKTFTATFEMNRVEDASGEVTQADIEKKIIGSWIVAERNGQPALTNEKGVFTFVSPTKAYISASFGSHPERGVYWMNMLEAEVEINGNKVTITRKGVEGEAIVNELTITNITDTEKQGNLVVKSINDGKVEIITEEPIRFVKVNNDYSDDIIGTWEGRCTSEGSLFDDGQDHRWEFKDDGTYVYYVKDGDKWVPADAAEGDYFVAGNLLCGRWFEGKTENREWWEITIDGNKMNWTALREGEDGKTFTATFEMKKVEE